MNRWTEEDKAFVRDNAAKLTVDQICKCLRRSETSVKLFMHRNRLVIGNTVKRNLIIELLKLRYKHPEDFTPSAVFYRETGITPQRWWKMYKGKLQVSEIDYISLTKYFSITLQEAFNTRQLSLFDMGGGME